MRVWLSSWQGWPLLALAVAAGCLVAAGNWWNISRAYDDDTVRALAAQAAERAVFWVERAVAATVVAVVLRAVKGRGRRGADRLDPAAPGGAG